LTKRTLANFLSKLVSVIEHFILLAQYIVIVFVIVTTVAPTTSRLSMLSFLLLFIVDLKVKVKFMNSRAKRNIHEFKSKRPHTGANPPC
jgi:1,4-dihydroxy-2-naphthoate octaprenyltransferase